MLLSLHEFTTNSPWVFITKFIYHNCIVTTEEGESKNSVFIIWFRRDKFALESKNVNVVLENFLHIHRRSFRLKTFYILKCVFFTS
jgi:hypothetical protein